MRNRTAWIFPAIAFAVILAIAAVGGVAYAGSTNNVTCTVNSKESVVKSTENGTGHEYRLYTEGVDGCDVFTVSDELWSLNFESASTYNQIKEGETYSFTTRGWRVPIFSMFPNVVRVR